MSTTVREAAGSDAAAIARIHTEGIADRVATFETTPPTAAGAAAMIASEALVLVAERDGEVSGFAKAAPYCDPAAYYDGIGEATVYVGREARGAGLGPVLLSALATEAERRGLYKLVGKIFASNRVSLRTWSSRSAGERSAYTADMAGWTVSGRTWWWWSCCWARLSPEARAPAPPARGAPAAPGRAGASWPAWQRSWAPSWAPAATSRRPPPKRRSPRSARARTGPPGAAWRASGSWFAPTARPTRSCCARARAGEIAGVIVFPGEGVDSAAAEAGNRKLQAAAAKAGSRRCWSRPTRRAAWSSASPRIHHCARPTTSGARATPTTRGWRARRRGRSCVGSGSTPTSRPYSTCRPPRTP